MTPPKRVALVLSGCGFYDGTEIQESVACIFALSKANAQTHFFAPDKPQAHVIDHMKGEPTAESRNVLKEAARITRGNIKPLTDLNPNHFDALIIPGGFGVAKNLSTFAFDGTDMTIDSHLLRVIKDFHAHSKPIGMCCIAPIIAAKAFAGSTNPASITLGGPSEAADAAIAMGATHTERPVNEIERDATNNLITAPAYMYDNAKPHEVQQGIEKMVNAVIERTAAQTTTAMNA